MSSVRRRLAGLACLPLLVLSACSDDLPSSSAEPTPTVTASVDPTPTQAPETPRDRVPEKAREQSQAGAIAFARYWVKVFNRARVSQETDDLQELSHEECETCTNFAERINSTAANGGSYQGGTWKVLRAGTPPEQSAPGEEIVELRVAVAKAVSKPTSDAVAHVSEATDLNLSVYLRWVGDGWIVTWVRLHE